VIEIYFLKIFKIHY